MLHPSFIYSLLDKTRTPAIKGSMKVPHTFSRYSLSVRFFAGALMTALLLAPPLKAQENLMPHGALEVWATPSSQEEAHGISLPDGIPDKSWVVFYPNKAVKGVPDDAEAYGIVRDVEIKRSGEASLRLDADKDTIDFGVHFQPTKVNPSSKYRITLWIKGEEIHPNPKLNSKHSGTLIRWQAGSPKSYWGGEGQSSHIVELPDELKQGTFDWTPVEMEVETTDATEVLGFRVVLQAASGKLWVDDISIEPLPN